MWNLIKEAADAFPGNFQWSFDIGLVITLLISFVVWMMGRFTAKKEKRKALMNYVAVDWNTVDEELKGKNEKNHYSDYVVVIGNYSNMVLRDFSLKATAAYEDARDINLFVPFLKPGEYLVESKLKTDCFIEGKKGQIADALVSMDKMKANGIFYHPMTNAATKSMAKGYHIEATCMDEKGTVWTYNSRSLEEGKASGKYSWVCS